SGSTDMDMGQGGATQEQGFAGSGSDASTACRVCAEVETADTICTTRRLGFPIVQAEREAAPCREHARAQSPQARWSEGRCDSERLERPLWLPQPPTFIGVIPCTDEDRSKDRPSAAQTFRCEDHVAAVFAQCERRSDAGAGNCPGSDFGQQNGRKRTE